MRNQSEETVRLFHKSETYDVQWLMSNWTKRQIAEANCRMRKKLRRIKDRSESAAAKLKAEIMTKDMGHEYGLRSGEYSSCRLCGDRYWRDAPGVCAAKVNTKLDALVGLADLT